MNQRNILITASLFGACAVGLGAFGAHAFKAMLLANGRLDTYELAARYQFYHTLALLGVGMLIDKFPSLKTGALLLILGMVIFCGSLYILALANQPTWGAVTPVGGVLLILGCLSLVGAFYKSR